MLYIGGRGVLVPGRKLKRHVRKQIQVRKLVSDFLKHTSAFDTFAQTRKIVDSINRALPKSLPINSIYWPVGAMRFGVGVFLVTEDTADFVFALAGAQSRVTVAYDLFSITTGQKFTSHCLKLEAEQGDGGTGNVPVGNNSFITGQKPDPVLAASIMSGGRQPVNLNPVPVVASQRSMDFEPFKYQSYFATWMIPLIYIPLTESDNIIDRAEYRANITEGFGVLIAVDQRFIWHFIYTPAELMMNPVMNNCYFRWYDLLAFLSKFLLPEQTAAPALAPYGRAFFHDVVKPEAAFETDKCKEKERDKRKITFDDDRDYWGPPLDIFSEGRDLTLAEMFALIEQSLNKRLLFHPNWQIEFINPITARLRMTRNILMFTPRIVFPSDTLFGELEVVPPDKEKRLVSEFPIASGGLVRSKPTRALKVDDNGNIIVTKDKLPSTLTSPQPVMEVRTTFAVPHIIEVAGAAYVVTKSDVIKPSSHLDGAMIYPGAYTFYRCSLVPKGNISLDKPDLYDFPDDIKMTAYNPVGSEIEFPWYINIFIPGARFARGFTQDDTLIYDITRLRIVTSHLCLINAKASGEIKETKDESSTHLNRKQSWRLGRRIVRDYIAWILFPFGWHFKNMNYWPLTGYEDYLLIKCNGSVFVKGYQLQLLNKRQGIKYVGWQSPLTIPSVTDKHKLLDTEKHHVDCSGEDPSKGAVVAVAPRGSIIEVPSVTLEGYPLKTKASVWSAIRPPAQ